MVGWGGRLLVNVLEIKAVFQDVTFQNTVSKSVLIASVVAYINKQGGTHSVEMCAVENHDMDPLL